MQACSQRRSVGVLVASESPRAGWEGRVGPGSVFHHPEEMCGASGKELPANAGDTRDVGSIPGSERSSGGRHDNSLQYSCLENPMDRGAWQATVHRVAKSRTRLKRLSPRTGNADAGLLKCADSPPPQLSGCAALLPSLEMWRSFNVTTWQTAGTVRTLSSVSPYKMLGCRNSQLQVFAEC